MLATIWSDIDKLLQQKTEEKPVVNINFCRECFGVKIFSPEGLPTCSECGLIEDRYVDDTAEWTSGMNEDGKVKDPSRCGNPNANPELFSQHWGKGTIIATQH